MHRNREMSAQRRSKNATGPSISGAPPEFSVMHGRIKQCAALLVILPVLLLADGGDVPAERFSGLALACLHQEYPNKIAHVMSGDQDVGPPRELTPVFYGCFDWHSSVHGHWLLVRMLRLYPQGEFAQAASEALHMSFQADKVAVEVEYARHEERDSFERPYGIAWLLQLMAELREWDDPLARQWQATLEPLEAVYVDKSADWLNKLAYPIRIGEHAQTAFAFALFIDWARASGRQDFNALVKQRTLEFHAGDVNCPLDYEPGGQDFLSPCLAEADLMRRVMSPQAYAQWLRGFLPRIPEDGSANWLPLARITDRSDGKLAHLDGLHLSRAWALRGMASGLPGDDKRLAALESAAQRQGEAGLAAVTGEHYEGGHWLASFATYLITRRGLGEVGQNGPGPDSEHAGDQGLPVGGIVGEALAIPGLVTEGARCEVAESKQGKGQACQ
jgi:hypothetical protein